MGWIKNGPKKIDLIFCSMSPFRFISLKFAKFFLSHRKFACLNITHCNRLLKYHFFFESLVKYIYFVFEAVIITHFVLFTIILSHVCILGSQHITHRLDIVEAGDPKDSPKDARLENQRALGVPAALDDPNPEVRQPLQKPSCPAAVGEVMQWQIAGSNPEVEPLPFGILGNANSTIKVGAIILMDLCRPPYQLWSQEPPPPFA
jgi:hypothetical protein